MDCGKIVGKLVFQTLIIKSISLLAVAIRSDARLRAEGSLSCKRRRVFSSRTSESGSRK